MKRWIAPLTAVMIGVSAAVPAFAQDQQPNQPQQPDNAPRRGLLMVCSTANPTETVAKALGMSATDLRLALVSGKTVSQLAASQNVDMQVIKDALTSQRQADLEQAKTDGLISQDEYDQIIEAQKNAPTGNDSMQRELRVPEHNLVNRPAVAAQALGMTCAELVKATQDGRSIAEIAVDKGVAVQTVIDAVTNAQKDALAQDVKEGLITQAQADGRTARLTLEIGQWVYNTQPDDGQQGGGQPGGQQGGGRPGGQQGGGQPGGQQGGQGGNRPGGQQGGQGGGQQGGDNQPPAAPPNS